ncbi:Os01g0297950 [Oryza sativa Japonica Group]|jgi:hypothetical protein|uniref:Os01g0297950 protein n=1 Tax=Oryza sativa subsp. japonica TaxID=39947 RepID=A0A0P0V1Z3_ORYSJ|nr:Os01g0297950 [Oryza sativa Japonica Group]
MSKPSFHTATLLSMAALTPAHCTPAIKHMMVVLVYGAENRSDILVCMMNHTAHAAQLRMMRTSPRTAAPPAAGAAAPDAALSANRQWMGDAQSLRSGPL